MFELPDAILLPVFGHLILVAYLFIQVSIKRMQAVRDKQAEYDDYAHKTREPEISRRWVNNLNNQFELPLLFYVLVALLFATQSITMTYVWLGWIFLIGRVAHTAVQTSTDNVQRRGMVFGINLVALAAMWLIFLMDRLV